MYEIVMNVCNPFKSECVTGAPGVAPVAGKPGLTMGIMGAPGAPGLHRNRRKEKETVRQNFGHLMGVRAT